MENGTFCEVDYGEEEKTRIEGEGKGAAVLLSVSLCIAESEINLYSLVDTGGRQEGICVIAAVEILNSAGGGATIAIYKVSIITK